MLKTLAAAALISLAAAVSGPDLPPGPYCGQECCDGRLDDCSHPILGTLCYCDAFCSRNGTTANHDDCCPDYSTACLGEPPTEPLRRQPCEHEGKYYYSGDVRQDNCNTCKCSALENSNDYSDQWTCTQEPCLVSEELISGVNRLAGAGWRASNYTAFWGRKLSEGVKLKLGTLPLSEQTLRMRPDPSYTDKPTFPTTFDARSRWPRFITPVYDQGWCGADWAVSTAAVASDRFAIQSNGAEAVRLSAQQLVSCVTRRQQGCGGGHIDGAWTFARKYGLVDEDCFPYTGTDSASRKCPRSPGSLLSAGCGRSKNGRTDRYKTSPPKRLGSVDDIMYEIMNSGPVQAVMTVEHDFFHYRSGIYRQTRAATTILGLHSVRIIGWGEERGTKYWLVANSWGEQWGENGYFRIVRGENESRIETFVISTLAYVEEANDDYNRLK